MFSSTKIQHFINTKVRVNVDQSSIVNFMIDELGIR